MTSLPRRRSFGSSRNLFVGEERLRDEPKERLRGRLVMTGLPVGLDTLCRHNFGHNGIVRASSIMPE